MVLLLDAANTLIHKPSFPDRFLSVLLEQGLEVDKKTFSYHHKLLSEAVVFPDKTSPSFYHEFNSLLLYSLGILPEESLLNEIFSRCSYLPWVPFDDVRSLSSWSGKIAILSNFHSGLVEILENCLPGLASSLFISEKSEFRKPDVRFYEEAITRLGVDPADILYIGDSPKLDLEPALKTGMNAWLIDRDGFYPASGRRISSFSDIYSLVNR